jgi:hypothetical protein
MGLAACTRMNPSSAMAGPDLDPAYEDDDDVLPDDDEVEGVDFVDDRYRRSR